MIPNQAIVKRKAMLTVTLTHICEKFIFKATLLRYFFQPFCIVVLLLLQENLCFGYSLGASPSGKRFTCNTKSYFLCKVIIIIIIIIIIIKCRLLHLFRVLRVNIKYAWIYTSLHDTRLFLIRF